MAKSKKIKSEHSIKQTPMENAAFCYGVEIDVFPNRFINPEYLRSFLVQEANVIRSNSKVLRWLLILNSLALIYIQGVKLEYNVWGYNIANFPVATHILCLLLGLNLIGFAMSTLDVMLFSRLRTVLISKAVGTDLVNIATAHLKGSGVWVDLISPRYIGYKSSRPQQSLGLVFGLMFILLFSILFFFSAYSLGSLYLFGLEKQNYKFNWANVTASVGVLVGAVGIVIFFGTQFIKFTYTLNKPENPSPEGEKMIIQSSSDNN